MPVRQLTRSSAVALVVRHVAVVMTPDRAGDQALDVHPESGATLTLDNSQFSSPHRQVLGAIELSRGVLSQTRFRSLMYSDMLSPLRGLARLIEGALQALTAAVGNSGVAVILFGLMLRAVLLPLGLWSIRKQCDQYRQLNEQANATF